MFGPNTYFQDDVKINFSHRDKVFFDLFSKTKELFINTFSLQNYDIIFIPGSGSVGIESIFYSIKHKINLIGVEGTFKSRWEALSKEYNPRKSEQEVNMCCLLETSCSTTNLYEGCIVDAISGFPYYDIPKDTLAFVTCLNKQLGSYVGLAVVGVRKDCWHMFQDDSSISYLNLARYKHYHDLAQTPTTAPTFIYQHFYNHLQKFDVSKLREKCNTVSDMVVNTIGEDCIIGDKRGPVITLKENVIPEELAQKFDIYGYWAKRKNFQIFTYTQDISYYQEVLKEYKNSKH